jgi:hypothetical protein
MKRFSVFIISLVILISLLILIVIFEQPTPPIISMPSGFYTQPFTVSMSSKGQNETIHYTLDGSIPTLDSPVYSEPLLINDRSNDQNDISMIRTISYRYREPVGNVKKITILRTRSFSNITKAESEIITKTYLVGEDIHERYSVPIISLVVDPKDFFDPKIGIYVTGEEYEVAASADDYYYNWPANYSRRGKEWEKNIYVEFFDTQGAIGFSQNAGVRLHGGASRSYRQKSFRVYARSKYDVESEFNYPLFPDLFDSTGEKRIDSFKSFILRNSGTDFGATFMRDVLIQKLVNHTSVATQAINPVIVFLNGEYWGLYYLYEHHHENYFLDHYDIEPKNLILLEGYGEIVIGAPKDQDRYNNLLDYLNTHDNYDQNFYLEISRKIDIENFIDYQITQIYTGNTDWPASNIKYWRSRTTTDDFNVFAPNDGRWRWLLYDLDHGFQFLDVNGIEHATNQKYPTTILRALINNPNFTTQFLNRFADHINTTFQSDRVIQEINKIESVLEPEMQEQIDRWHSSGGEMRHWKNNVEFLRIFARERPKIMLMDLVDFFDLYGTFEFSSDINNGYLRVNSIDILSTTPGIQNPNSYSGVYFQNIPIIITAIPHEGYQFSHWEGSVYNNETSPIIEILSTEDVRLDPIFISIE